jgi:LAS superfamily LD-carboxypeptidase LdcB
VDAASLAALNTVWMRRRPFVAISASACPAPPPPERLAWATPAESYGPLVELRAGALGAYRAMVAAARRDLPQLASQPRLMTLVSGFRSPDADAARCAAEHNCQGVTRATCSAHRTGLAMDLNLGAAPGGGPASSSLVNRLYISRGAAYRWMVANADRFGFVPYPFEPWHWEWTGEAP